MTKRSLKGPFSISSRNRVYQQYHNLKAGTEFTFIVSEQNDILQADPKIAPRLEDFAGLLE